jgi:hypothetical protein
MASIIYTPPATPPTPPLYPGGNPGSVQYNNTTDFKGLDFLESNATGGHQQFIVDDGLGIPPPPQGKSIIYASSNDGDEALSTINSWEKDFPLQINIGHKIIGMSWPTNGASPSGAFAWNGYVTSVGSLWSSSTALATKSYSAGTTLPNISRMNGATLALINQSAEIYVNTINRSAIIGSAAQAWGTKLIITFGLPTYKSDQRFFIGYVNAAAALGAAVDPSSYLNSIAIIKDSASNRFFFYVRGAGIASTQSTGFEPTLNGLYRLTVFIPSSGGSCYMSFDEILVGSVNNANYTNNTTMPAIGTAMFPHLMANTGPTTTTAINLSLVQMYEEQL